MKYELPEKMRGIMTKLLAENYEQLKDIQDFIDYYETMLK